MPRPGKLFKMASEAVREGVFAINKPCGPTSSSIVRQCVVQFSASRFFKDLIQGEVAKMMASTKGQPRKRLLKKASEVKVGHGGTLDPLATGVLIIGVGSGTKALPQFLECTKTYEAVVLFGASSDTYDRVGRLLTKRPYDHITREKVEKELEHFRGKRTQIPPLYSALKMNGKPLYEYAREGRPIPREIEGREVTAHEVEIVEWYDPKTHSHRWPTEQAEAAELNLAEQVWRLKKQQENAKQLTEEEKAEDEEALIAHETFKKAFEERQDDLIRDSPSRRQRHHKEPPMMSGALGKFPESSKQAVFAAEASNENTPPPWSDEGPPAVKIRLTVSSGYYVRSFCHDLGARLGSAALMAELCRTRQSDFTVDGVNCLRYEELDKGEEAWGPQLANMLARWNGEPEGNWPGPSASKDKSKDNHKPHANSNSQSSQKRARSPSSQDPNPFPRKAQARDLHSSSSPRSTLKANSSQGARSEDEKSWNGIED